MAGVPGSIRRATAAFALIGLAWPLRASADEPTAADSTPAEPATPSDEISRTGCAAAYEKGQELRSAAKLHAAEQVLAVCAAPSCPSFIRADCTGWLDEVDRAMPTLVFGAKDPNGNDALDVKVTADGATLLSELDGKPVSVDPGPHLFRFELEGAAPIEMRIVAHQSEKDRVVEVNFEPPVKDLPNDDPYATAGADATRPGKPGPLRPYSYAAGGVGAAGILGWAILGLLGRSEENHLDESGCRPHCSQSAVDAARTKYIAADVSLGVGIAALGAGVALFFLSQPKPAPARSAAFSLDVAPTTGGAYGSFGGRF